MTAGLHIQVWTMRTGGLSEDDVAPWRDILDATEQARAARFMFSRHRITYIAAHALVRSVLSRVCAGIAPRAWHFVPGEHGKPVAWIGGRPAALTFNLSHTDGFIGLATLPDADATLGFDVEAIDRKVTLEVADRYFRPEEVAWIGSLPVAARPAGFLHLWTLKEAFIKATGQGLAHDLASFWFTLPPPRIRFTPALVERSEEWVFEQRVIGGEFIAAVGLRGPAGVPIPIEWIEMDPAQFRPTRK